MALLELKNIGKIYTSEGSAAVGIRGVNASFELGEFVAITGQSGSGKTTLLNVISGMDSFEEGEMYINGEETSYYSQADWEIFRERYISFIFQDYNIIESFTVLQNVELALMHITDAKERRKRALELLKRVGMDKHLKHRGSQLSGGQKQRTVIARALAKDSPIILADEPTGNLDAETSKEIIALLKEVSADKLLIMVTHDFDDVAEYATRELRIFDGGVASDRILAGAPMPVPAEAWEEEQTGKQKKHSTVRNGVGLGWSIFCARPMLSVYMTLLMIITALGLFLGFVAFWGASSKLFVDHYYMFNPIPGRVVVVRNDGEFISDEELEILAKETGAKDYLHLDYGLDRKPYAKWLQDYNVSEEYYVEPGYMEINYVYDQDYGKLDLGRYPQAEDEVVLRLPYFMKEYYGTTEMTETIRNVGVFGDYKCKIVGISYYLDSRKQGEICFTKEGYLLVSMDQYQKLELKYQLTAKSDSGSEMDIGKFNIPYWYPQEYESKQDVILCTSKEALENVQNLQLKVFCVNGTKTGVIATISLEDTKVIYDPGWEEVSQYDIIIPQKVITQHLVQHVGEVYKQASLFYASGSQVKKAVKQLSERGYAAVPADTTFRIREQKEYTELLVAGIVSLILWGVLLVLLVAFLRLCTRRSMIAFRPDIAIMRSMGIRVSEIRIAICVRIMICMLLSILVLPVIAYAVYRSDFGGKYLLFLHARHYLIIFLMEFWVVMQVAGKTIKSLFGANVRKVLKGDVK